MTEPIEKSAAEKSAAPRLAPAGDAAVLVTFADRIDPRASAAVLALDEALRWDPFDGFIEATPSFAALLARFDPLLVDYEEAAEAISALLRIADEASAPGAPSGRLWRFPAAYGGEAGPDLASVAAHLSVSEEAVVALHVGAEHQVYMLGFLPGAPYLGGLPPDLDLPRLAEPRVAVPAGSVAIAGGLSVIYPVQSPGGWRLLGRTPVALFSPEADPPALLAPGDRIRFEPASLEDVETLATRAAAGEWRPAVDERSAA